MKSCLDKPCESAQQSKGRRPWRRLTHWMTRKITAYRSRPKVRVVPISSPEAFVERPGERRIVFSNRVMIVTQAKEVDQSER